MPTRVRSHCKINLGLAIGPSRPDGFHALTTVYETLALHDIVTVSARPASTTSIAITTTDPRVPTDASNTAWRIVERALAGRALAERPTTAAVEIHIEKRLPVQGGIGGGSGNAIAALVGLERELGLGIPAAERLRLAAAVGSDIPLFLIGGAVLGLGRGEEVYPLPDLPEMPCVLALPAVGVSTPQAYRDWDMLHMQGSAATPNSRGPEPGLAFRPAALTVPPPSATLDRLSRAVAGAFSEPYSSGVLPLGEDLAGNPLLALVRTGIENDFERVVFPQHPSLGDIKRILAGSPQSAEAALFVSLSGSGSALFGLYADQAAAEAALHRLASHQVTGVVTRTLPREAYWRTMVEA